MTSLLGIFDLTVLLGDFIEGELAKVTCWWHRDRKKEILSDERVQAAQKAGRGGRVRNEQETAAASSVTVVGKSDSRAQASPAQNGSRAEVGIFPLS